MDFATKVIHAGIHPEASTGAVMTPIFQTSTFAQSGAGEHKGYEYSRTDNPTRTVLQSNLAELENAEYALVYSSGLATIDAILNTLKVGDHVLACDDLYGGTRRLFNQVAVNRGLSFGYSPLCCEDEVRQGITSSTRMIWIETPTNPLLRIIDIEMLSRIAREKQILVAVDNTFMSPFFQNPLTLGADVVMHSMTKYINGHSDVVMGALMVNDKGLYERLKFLQNAVGAVSGPFESWLVLRGIKTLALRMERHAHNAQLVAEYLESHSRVAQVIYPGLPSHPQHQLARKQMHGFGGMISFFIRGGQEEARNLLRATKLFTVAESLGGVESLIEHPALMTHASLPEEVRAELGIGDSLIRASVGIESVTDLISDLDQALAKM